LETKLRIYTALAIPILKGLYGPCPLELSHQPYSTRGQAAQPPWILLRMRKAKIVIVKVR